MFELSNTFNFKQQVHENSNFQAPAFSVNEEIKDSTQEHAYSQSRSDLHFSSNITLGRGQSPIE
jgi:hypothetical protein